MQVSLLVSPGAARGEKAAGGAVVPLIPDMAQTVGEDGTEALRRRARRDDRARERAAEVLAPTGSAAVIQDAERRSVPGSRSFRRQTARAAGAEQFSQEREQFRQALRRVSREGSPAPTVSPDRGEEKVGVADRSAGEDGGDQKRSAGGATPSSAKSGAPVAPKGGVAAVSTACSGCADRVTARDSVSVPTPTLSALATAMRIRAVETAEVPRPAGGAPVAAAGRAPGAGKAGVSGGSRAGADIGAARGAEVRRGRGRVASSRARFAGAAKDARKDANIERMVRVIRASFKAGRSRTVMHLEPGRLGSLRLQLDLRGEGLAVRIDTSTELAHRLLSRETDKLRDGLEASGIRLERIEIRPPSPAPPGAEQGHPQQGGVADGGGGGAAQPNAEHSAGHGRESSFAESAGPMSRESDPEPAAESLVNVIA